MLNSCAKAGIAAAALLALAACGESRFERGATGAGIGAGAGAAAGALTGAPATGALLGGAAGGAAGAFTDESDLDLGEPLWE